MLDRVTLVPGRLAHILMLLCAAGVSAQEDTWHRPAMLEGVEFTPPDVGSPSMSFGRKTEGAADELLPSAGSALVVFVRPRYRNRTAPVLLLDEDEHLVGVLTGKRFMTLELAPGAHRRFLLYATDGQWMTMDVAANRTYFVHVEVSPGGTTRRARLSVSPAVRGRSSFDEVEAWLRRVKQSKKESTDKSRYFERRKRKDSLTTALERDAQREAEILDYRAFLTLKPDDGRTRQEVEELVAK